MLSLLWGINTYHTKTTSTKNCGFSRSFQVWHAKKKIYVSVICCNGIVFGGQSGIPLCQDYPVTLLIENLTSHLTHFTGEEVLCGPQSIHNAPCFNSSTSRISVPSQYTANTAIFFYCCRQQFLLTALSTYSIHYQSCLNCRMRETFRILN